MNNTNAIKNLLIDLGISTNETIVPYFPRVRDRDDISVLKCEESGVIFLSQTNHMDISHYNKKEGLNFLGSNDRKEALKTDAEDTLRRFNQFKNTISNKNWLDVGTGIGGILDLLSPVSKSTQAVEPQENARKVLAQLGYDVFSSIDDIKNNSMDVVTLFHVLEHLTTPIETLKTIRKKMIKGGKVIIEVPHANDFLISFLENEPFKKFTFWSEHLILHTRESLNSFLKKAGFSNITISGFQRYPLTNHLYWLSKGKPGGHIAWNHIRTHELDHAYANMLATIDKTDTLIAVAEN